MRKSSNPNFVEHVVFLPVVEENMKERFDFLHNIYNFLGNTTSHFLRLKWFLKKTTHDFFLSRCLLWLFFVHANNARTQQLCRSKGVISLIIINWKAKANNHQDIHTKLDEIEAIKTIRKPYKVPSITGSDSTCSNNATRAHFLRDRIKRNSAAKILPKNSW